MSKENAASFIIVACAYGMLTGMPKKRVLSSITVFVLVFAVYLFLRQGGTLAHRMLASPGSKDAFFSSGITHSNFIPVLSGALGYYFEKLVLPFNLNILPDIPMRPIYLLISLMPFVFGAIIYFSGRKTEAFLTVWIIATMLPSLFILFSQIAAPLGERYLYLPSAGFAMMAGILLSRIKIKKIYFASSVILLIIFSVSTYERLKDWKDDAALWEATVKKSPASVVAHTNYGKALLEKQEFGTGEKELLAALRQKNISYEQASNVYDLLGTMQMRTNNLQKAETYLKSALSENSENATAHNNLGILYLRMSDSFSEGQEKKKVINEAIRNLEKASAISPDFIQPKFNLGLCFLQKHDFDTAKNYFNSVIQADPRSELSSQATQLLLITEFVRRKIPKDI
jgi:tetratricopeptide (TPR) repeat protein